MRTIATVLFVAMSVCVLYAYAEDAGNRSVPATVDESMYNKDTVPIDSTYACQVGIENACELPVLISKAGGKIEYYWSERDLAWMPAGSEQATLQSLYDRRKELRDERQLKSMREEMDRRQRQSLEDTATHDIPGHR